MVLGRSLEIFRADEPNILVRSILLIMIGG